MSQKVDLRKQISSILDTLNEKDAREVIDFACFLQSKHNKGEEQEMLKDKQTLRDILLGIQEIREGKVVKWQKVREDV